MSMQTPQRGAIAMKVSRVALATEMKFVFMACFLVHENFSSALSWIELVLVKRLGFLNV